MCFTIALSCYSPHSQSSGSQASLKESVEERLLQECAVIITRKLDISTILSHLLQCGLLTRKDQQFLLNQMRTDDDKVYYLLYNLPRKADGWFDRFLECLRDSQEGTGHKDIADTLEAKLKEARHQSSLNIPTTVPIPVTSDTDEVCLNSQHTLICIYQFYSLILCLLSLKVTILLTLCKCCHQILLSL